MKIYEYIKSENRRESKILGLTIYEQYSDYKTGNRTQNFLNGFISTSKVSDNYEYHIEKEVKIAGKSFIKRVLNDNEYVWYFTGIPIKRLKLAYFYKKHYLKGVKERYDDVYILDANSGEIYLFLVYFLNAYMKKNVSKKVLLVATKKYHIDLIETICPEIPYIFRKKLRKNINADKFNYDGINFYMVFQHSHFKRIDNELHKKNEDLNYFKAIKERLNIRDSEIEMRKVVISEDIRKSVYEKVKQTGLNINNFIFVSPEANSCRNLPENFWRNLINKYKELGYDIYVNLTDGKNIFSGGEYKSIDLSYKEAFVLAELAKKIVALRSGLVEFLLQTNVPMDILYTEFSNRHLFDDITSEYVLKGFSLKNLPYINKDIIREFVISDNSYEELLPQLCS